MSYVIKLLKLVDLQMEIRKVKFTTQGIIKTLVVVTRLHFCLQIWIKKSPFATGWTKAKLILNHNICRYINLFGISKGKYVKLRKRDTECYRMIYFFIKHYRHQKSEDPS